jgi:hypothetical protein
VQEALGQLKILLLLFIFGQENLNSIYPHETAKSLKYYDEYTDKIPMKEGE